jgi:hypothetical protein
MVYVVTVMKHKKGGRMRIWYILGALIAFTSMVQAQTHDSCLAMFARNDTISGYYNEDSMMVDTCYLSSTAGQRYVRAVLIKFDNDLFHLPAAPADTIIEVGWQDMDTNYPALRTAFDTIYHRFGAYVLQKIHPEDTNSLSIYLTQYKLIFDHYTCLKPLAAFLDSLSDTLNYSIKEPRYPSESVPTDIIRNSIEIVGLNRDILTLKIQSGGQDKLLSIIDINGKIILQKTVDNEVLIIPLQQFRSGNYFVLYNHHSIPISIF